MPAHKLTEAELSERESTYAESGFTYIRPRKIGHAESTPPDESYHNYAVFSRAQVEAAYGTIDGDNAEEVACNLTGWAPGYGGVGRWFRTVPHIRVLGRNVLVKQFCGLDI